MDLFWGNSHYSSTNFRLQKRIIRIIVGIGGRDSCREHFKKLKILPSQSQYILSPLLFVINNRDYFIANSEIHNINTRTKSNLHQPISNLSTYQKGTYYSGIKVYNSLPTQINPYPTAFPYGNGMVLHFYQQQESSTTKTVHKVINKGLKTYV